MMSNTASALMGSVSLASLVVALFFLKFWRKTRDEFFLFFAAASPSMPWRASSAKTPRLLWTSVMGCSCRRQVITFCPVGA